MRNILLVPTFLPTATTYENLNQTVILNNDSLRFDIIE